MSDHHRYTAFDIQRMRDAAFRMRELKGPYKPDEAFRTAEAMVLTWIAAGITPDEADADLARQQDDWWASRVQGRHG